MVKEQRFEQILSILKRNGTVNFSDLAETLAVSEDTIRRDIETLHRRALLMKVRGGAMTVDKNPLTFHDRSNFQSSEKQIIALKVQGLLKKGTTIFMDGGTTVCTVAEHFPIDSSFRVVTHNMALVPILSRFKNIELIVLGGWYNADTQTTLGTKTSEDISSYVADLYLMGTCAISHQFGVTAVVLEDGRVKQAMLKASKKTAVLANSAKVGTSEGFKVCDIDSVDFLITELRKDDRKLDSLRKSNISIL